MKAYNSEVRHHNKAKTTMKYKYNEIQKLSQCKVYTNDISQAWNTVTLDLVTATATK